MAKAAKPGKSNGFDPEQVQSFAANIEAIQAKLASEQGSYMARCRKLRDEIGAVMDEAKDAGIPKKILKKNLKRRELEGKIEELREELEPEEQETYDQIRHALGDLADLPLGQVSLGRQADIEDLLEDEEERDGGKAASGKGSTKTKASKAAGAKNGKSSAAEKPGAEALTAKNGEEQGEGADILNEAMPSLGDRPSTFKVN